jgi:1-acyl-sn-glycerol-3-phosphate acyltransferase
MHKIEYTDNRYRTSNRSLSLLPKMFPSILFYPHLFYIIYQASRLGQKGQYDGSDWVESSFAVMKRLEDVGVRIDISGIENVEQQSGPVVFVGNHMSMLETLVLPAIIQPIKPVTFVVKESLLSYPVFKHVMRARDPIAVTRTNPRQDLKTVLNGGLERLQNDISIIVFPQTTRSHIFDSKQMSSIGVKLAKKAGVPIIPLALKTDCWQNGRKFKDFGRLDITKTAYFSFGEVLQVEGKGDAEQATINSFISRKINEWEASA